MLVVGVLERRDVDVRGVEETNGMLKGMVEGRKERVVCVDTLGVYTEMCLDTGIGIVDLTSKLNVPHSGLTLFDVNEIAMGE